ncbi:hypothetical protein FBR02_09205 [Anaerolineae bacterium CFX9]|nr:hypothetical protein [Anaerolineae bacterium CFX9]
MNNNPSDEFSFDDSGSNPRGGQPPPVHPPVGGSAFDFSDPPHGQVYPGQMQYPQQPYHPYGALPSNPYLEAQSRAYIQQVTRRRTPWLWIFIILMSVGLPLVIVAVILLTISGTLGNIFGPDFLGGLGGIGSAVNQVIAENFGETRALPDSSNDPTRFDPLAALADIQAWAGADARLMEINARYVRSDGTLDLNASYGSSQADVEYVFFRAIERPADAPPPGAPGAGVGQWYEQITINAYRPGQMRQISSVGGSVSVRTQVINQGMTRRVGRPTTNLFPYAADEFVGYPDCSFAAIWQEMIARGAPAEGVAFITYNADGYSFNISGVGIGEVTPGCVVTRWTGG